MVICGQTFSPWTIENFQRLVDETPDLSCRALSIRVCDLLAWRHPNGRLKDVSCHKALSRLHKIGTQRLPDVVQNLAFTSHTFSKNVKAWK
jgi:hypothetical protein